MSLNLDAAASRHRRGPASDWKNVPPGQGNKSRAQVIGTQLPKEFCALSAISGWARFARDLFHFFIHAGHLAGGAATRQCLSVCHKCHKPTFTPVVNTTPDNVAVHPDRPWRLGESMTPGRRACETSLALGQVWASITACPWSSRGRLVRFWGWAGDGDEASGELPRIMPPSPPGSFSSRGRGVLANDGLAAGLG